MPSDKIGAFTAYSKISHSMQDSIEFRSMTRHEKLVWYHVLCSKTICTGIVNQSIFDVTKYNDYVDINKPEKIKDGVDFVRGIFEKLKGLGWIEYDNDAHIILLPRRLKHDLPPNYNVLISRIKALRQVPKSVIRTRWISYMSTCICDAFNETDSRCSVVKMLQETISQLPLTNEEVPENTKETKQGSNHYPVVHSEPVIGLNDALEKLSKRFRDSREQRADSRQQRADKKRGATPSSLPKPATVPSKPQLSKFKKVKEPPPGKSPRWRSMWEAILTAEFYVPGSGTQTVWENVKDPADLCDTLSGPGYPKVEPELIHRLANWTRENKVKGKKQVGRFLLNRFSAEQDKPKRSFDQGGNRGGFNQQVAPKHAELKEPKKETEHQLSQEEIELNKLSLKGALTPEQEQRLEELRNEENNDK